MKRFTMYAPETKFTSFFNSVFEEAQTTHSNAPKATIRKTRTKLILNMQVPGYSKENISISIQDNAMTISSLDTSKADVDGDISKLLDSDYSFVLNEFSISNSSWKRTFTFDKKYSLEKSKATVKNGILTVTIPRDSEKSLKVDIKVN